VAARYKGRPLLRLLDCYVLAVIGYLEPQMETQVAELVARYWGRTGDWKETLITGVGLPGTMTQSIADLWREQSAGTDPLRFALQVSNDNFVELIDPAK
jgi:hypothetical protein